MTRPDRRPWHTEQSNDLIITGRVNWSVTLGPCSPVHHHVSDMSCDSQQAMHFQTTSLICGGNPQLITTLQTAAGQSVLADSEQGCANILIGLAGRRPNAKLVLVVYPLFLFNQTHQIQLWLEDTSRLCPQRHIHHLHHPNNMPDLSCSLSFVLTEKSSQRYSTGNLLHRAEGINIQVDSTLWWGETCKNKTIDIFYAYLHHATSLAQSGPGLRCACFVLLSLLRKGGKSRSFDCRAAALCNKCHWFMRSSPPLIS